ncbi:hypothetical protein F5884DRAFT_781170 [Xylogone sp. PMI_703]|nr:hypothetical protein F5884DRAFT_781170 [Xylogone sp. PMI_703]
MRDHGDFESEPSGSEESEMQSISEDEESDSSLEVVDWMEELQWCLDDINSSGEFAAFRQYTVFPNPGLQIDGNITIPLPLLPRDAEAIKSVCREAPFGKGDQTLVDTSVRKTWELDHTQFQLVNPVWKPFLDTVVKHTSSSLGMLEVSIQPHKLLLYEQGSFFKRHKDSEKTPGMVGTLVICLPSQHQGGDVHLSFGSKSQVFSTAPTSTFDLTALGWFSDVTHEIKELVSGYRLVLTYNLIQTGSIKQSANFFKDQSQKLRQLLVKWQTKAPDIDRLLYPLEHQYSETSLSLRNLKGRDAAVCQCLLEVCSASGFYLFFANMTHRECEKWDSYYDDDDEDEGTSLDTIFTSDGTPISSNHYVDVEDILGGNIFEGRSPDSEDEGDFTGNESTPAAYRYHNTVAMIVPKRCLDQYLQHSAGRYVDNILSFLSKDLEQCQDSATKTSALSFMRKALQRNKNTPGITSSVIAQWAIKMNDDPLYQEAVKASIIGTSMNHETLKVVSHHLDSCFSDKPDAVVWDKWIGEMMNGVITLDGASSVLNSLEPLLQSQPLRSSFRHWALEKIYSRLQNKAQLFPADFGFIIDAIKSRRNDSEWIMTNLLPALTSSGTRELLYQILSAIFIMRTRPDFAAVEKKLFQSILESCYQKLSIGQGDFPAQPQFRSDQMVTYHRPSEELHKSSPLAQFTTLVDQSLSLRFPEQAVQLIEETTKSFSNKPTNWQGCNISLTSTVEFMNSVSTVLENQEVPVSDTLKSFFETLALHGIRKNLPTPPQKLPGWSHKPHKCHNGISCKDCESLNEFLVSTTEKVWRFPAAERRRSHIEHSLDRKLFKLETDRRGRTPYTLVVTKLGREYATDFARFQGTLQNLDKILAPLRRLFMRQVLGDSNYREMVMLESLRLDHEQSTVTGVKRPRSSADETDDVVYMGKRVK